MTEREWRKEAGEAQELGVQEFGVQELGIQELGVQELGVQEFGGSLIWWLAKFVVAGA